jgi:hypothetical protein
MSGLNTQYSLHDASSRHRSLILLIEVASRDRWVRSNFDVTMPVDPLSPIAPARIRALLLPVGRIKRSRFLAFVELLQQHSMVRLGDISPDTRADRSMNPSDYAQISNIH